VVSLVTVDMSLGDAASRTILSGVGSRNSIAVSRAGSGADAGGAINKMGAQFSININKSEGTGQAVRVLIELGLIEMLGKLTAVPYWQCLQIDKTSPQVEQQAREWFDNMSSTEQVSFMQKKLLQLGLYNGPTSGVLDDATRTALARFQTDNNLIADARPTFGTYYALMDTKGGQLAFPSSQTAPRPQAAVQRGPIKLVLSSDRGAQPIYNVNELLNATAQVKSDAFMYCYYKGADNMIARVYPNRFEANPFVRANQAISIPTKNSSKVKIRFDTAGAREQVVCFASNDDVGLGLPEKFKAEDLTPIGTTSIEELAGAFRAQDRTGLVQETLNITVKR